ncbi:MAG: hypothetical protein WAW73_19635 [Rhodoferax sp.]
MSTTCDFKMIRPVDVTDARLSSTSVPEATISEYAGGTTYAAGARAGITLGTVQTVYESLQNANTGHAPASSPSWWRLLGVVYAAYNPATTYAQGEIVSNIAANVHELYESVVAANVGNALTDTAKWLLLGSTNARAMFDSTYGSQTTNAESIVAVIAPGVLVNSMFLGNLDASSVSLAQSVSGYAKTINLNSHLVRDWYSYFYEDLVRVKDVVFDDIPPYAASSLTLTVSNPGDTAKCGICSIGKSVTLGETAWDVIGGNISYSGTTTDGFGYTTFVPRANVKKLNLDVYISRGFESEAHRLLSLYTDVPMVFIGSTDYSMTMAYGYLGNWQVPITNSGKPAPIEIKGLT